MGKILLLLSFPLLLSSCYTYQYVTVNSAALSKGNQQEFVMENDSFRLTYHFNGPIRLSLLNKTNLPVYIDWKQSSVIVNEQAVSYAPNSVPVAGSFSSEQQPPVASGSNLTINSGVFSAQIGVPSNTEFIPPGSRVNKSLLSVAGLLNVDIADSLYSRTRLAIPGRKTAAKGSYVAYSAEESPYRFRSYLTLFMADSVLRRVVLEHTFYISEVLRTPVSPDSYAALYGTRGDVYYLSQTTPAGAMVAFAGLTGAVILAVQAAKTTENDE